MANKKIIKTNKPEPAAAKKQVAADPTQTTSTAVSAYKQVLARVLDNRPSGTRQRLAVALAKNRSFVSQIANPTYATPIPAQHLEIIFEVCLFPNHEREAFLDAYAAAHPGRLERHRHHHHRKEHRLRPVTVYLPDLENDKKNQALDKLVSDLALRIAKLTEMM